MAYADTALATKATKQSFGDGLYLYTSTTGAQSWRWDYVFGDKRKTITHGAHPEMKLKEAKIAHFEAKGILAKGQDPMMVRAIERKMEETEASGETFKDYADRYMASRKIAWDAKYYALQQARLTADIIPQIGKLPINSIEPQIMLYTLRQIEKRGAIETADRMRVLCSQIFAYAIAEGALNQDPTASLKPALAAKPKKKNRPRVQPHEVAELFYKIDQYDADPLTRLGLLLALHTLVRTVELRFCRIVDLELDGKAPTWRIPKEIMKMDREHVVPLSAQAVKLFREAISAAPIKNGYVFASMTNTKVISENTMLYALYRIGYHKRQTVHGFRALGSTVLNESGRFDGDWIERQLAHDEDDKVRAAYNAAQYIEHRRPMMQWWSDYIDAKIDEGEGARLRHLLD